MTSDNARRPAVSEPPQAERPHIEVRDPKMMRALAHPLRVALIEAISQADTRTLTATEASELLGESPANCAFHLRTLAKYGFVEEAGGGRGRERPWRLSYRRLELVPSGLGPEARLAAHAAASIWIDRWLARARSRLMRSLGYPAHWQEATIGSQRGLYLTAQEAKDLGEAMHRLLEPYEVRLEDPSLRPPGSVRYEVMAFGYPLADPPDAVAPPGRSAAAASCALQQADSMPREKGTP
jgi:predicted transcriptional regulator